MYGQTEKIDKLFRRQVEIEDQRLTTWEDNSLDILHVRRSRLIPRLPLLTTTQTTRDPNLT